MLMITYNQRDLVGDALRAALAQTYSPLEIIVSDDFSNDGTIDVVNSIVEKYDGPHVVLVNRNDRNLGAGGNFAKAFSLSSGELLVGAAGDDVSVPDRCDRLVSAWLRHNKKPDLISSDLFDVDGAEIKGVIKPDDLGRYRGVVDWVGRQPYIVGAAHACTRRLFDFFGTIPRGVAAEDLIMVFRAISLGGAIHVNEPLVRYQRGGVSAKRKALSAQDVARGWLKRNPSALTELSVIKADALKAGCLEIVAPWLVKNLAYEEFIRDIFRCDQTWAKFALALGARGVPWSRRIRVLVYAAWPKALGPFFFVKRIRSKS